MAYYLDYISITQFMKSLLNRSETLATDDTREDFHLGASILLSLLFLIFIGTTFYLGISVYLEDL